MHVARVHLDLLQKAENYFELWFTREGFHCTFKESILEATNFASVKHAHQEKLILLA